MTFRRLFTSLLLSLMLVGSIASVAVAASGSALDTDPVEPPIFLACFEVDPTYQKVGVGEVAYQRFYGTHNCPYQRGDKVTIETDWGDGTVSVTPICTGEICLAVIPQAGHIYERAGTYYPVSCINIPGIYWPMPPCVQTQVDVVSGGRVE